MVQPGAGEYCRGKERFQFVCNTKVPNSSVYKCQADALRTPDIILRSHYRCTCGMHEQIFKCLHASQELDK